MEKYYRDKRSIEVKVGVITIVSLVILVLGYAWLKQYLDLRDYTRVTVMFENANNIKPGETVTMNGMEVGRIKSMQVREDGVLITLLVRLHFPLKEGTMFHLHESNLMGGKRIDIRPGKGPGEIDLTKVQDGKTDAGITGVFARLDNLVEKIEGILSNIGDTDGILADFNELADSAKGMIASLNEIIEENRAPLGQAVEGASKTFGRVNRILDENEEPIQRTVKGLDSAAQDARELFSRLDSLMVRFDRISRNIEDGDNTVSHLLYEKKLYDDMVNAVTELDSLLEDVKAHPTKYFDFSVF